MRPRLCANSDGVDTATVLAMRTLAVTQNITLDGAVEMLDDWFDAQGQGDVDNDDLMAAMRSQQDAADALLVGRQTFTDLRGYWPHVADDATGVSAYLNGVAKYVVSSTLTDPEWQNSSILAGDPVERVRDLKSRHGADVVVTGRITLCHALIGAGLVDEYRLFVYPVVQGRGRRLFPDGISLAGLRRLDARPFRSGITLLRYAAS